MQEVGLCHVRISEGLGTSLQLSGSGSEYGQFAWQPSAAQTFGNCNANQSFGPAVDVPPSVVSTVPAHLATGQANNVNIVVNFSEQVEQVSNAVPPPLARAIAGQIRKALLSPTVRR